MSQSSPKTKPTNPKNRATRGLYQRGEIWWLSFQRAGKRHWITLETADLAEAMARAQRLRAGPELAAKTGLEADVGKFIAHKVAKNVFSRATARVHGAALEEFAEGVPEMKTRDVRKAHVEAHYARLQKRVAEATAQIHIRALRSFFSWAGRAENPAKIELRQIHQKARKKFCTKPQRDGLIQGAPDDDVRFILFAGFHGGLRKGEIIEARADWFDLRKGGATHVQNTETFSVKDRDSRFIPMSKAFRKFLVRYLKGREPHEFALRPGVKHGKGTYRYDFHRPFNDYLVARDMRWVTAHVMRHTFASLLVQSGVSIFKVAAWLGDRVEVTEDHYAHLAPQDPDIERMT